MSTDLHTTDGFESASLRAPRILAMAAGAVALVFAAIFGLALVYQAAGPTQSVPPPRNFPEPRLRVDEAAQLHALQAHQLETLNSWRWIDRQKNVIGIPIARAMELIAKRGADAYEPVPGIPAQASGAP